MTASRRAQSEALITELQSVLREIHETEASTDPEQTGPGGLDLPALLQSLRALSEQCSARAACYTRAAGLVDRLIALWNDGKPGTEAGPGHADSSHLHTPWRRRRAGTC